MGLVVQTKSLNIIERSNMSHDHDNECPFCTPEPEYTWEEIMQDNHKWREHLKTIGYK